MVVGFEEVLEAEGEVVGVVVGVVEVGTGAVVVGTVDVVDLVVVGVAEVWLVVVEDDVGGMDDPPHALTRKEKKKKMTKRKLNDIDKCSLALQSPLGLLAGWEEADHLA